MRLVPETPRAAPRVVLLVDDDPWFCALMRDFLEHYRTPEAYCATEGLKVLRGEGVDPLLVPNHCLPDL